MKKLISIVFVLLQVSNAWQGIAQQSTVVYTADQNSNTVSVIDARKQQLLGKIKLGYPASDPRIFHPLYNGEINVHGINVDPLNERVAVVSTVSNSITLIDARTAQVIRKGYVGRNPHEPRFTRDGQEIWVTVRGENYVSVLDSQTLSEKQRIILSEGPGMVAFSPEGKTAYVCSSFDNQFWIINAISKKVIKTLTVPSTFSPFVNVSPDGKEVWVTHKDVGMVTRVSTEKREVIESFITGEITNHMTFADDRFFVTVGGENKVKVYKISDNNKALLTHEIPTDDLPHGIWYGTELQELYVVAELGNTFHIIDAESLQIKKTIPIGERPQALIPVNFSGTTDAIRNDLEVANPIFKGPMANP